MKIGSLDIRSWRQRNSSEIGVLALPFFPERGWPCPGWFWLKNWESPGYLYIFPIMGTECLGSSWIPRALTPKGFKLLQSSDVHVAESLHPCPLGTLGTKGNGAVSALWLPLPVYGPVTLAKHLRNFIWPFKWGCGYSFFPPTSAHPIICLRIKKSPINP